MKNKTYFSTNKESLDVLKEVITDRSRKRKLTKIGDFANRLGTFSEGIKIQHDNIFNRNVIYFFDEKNNKYLFYLDNMDEIEITSADNQTKVYNIHGFNNSIKYDISAFHMANVYSLNDGSNDKLHIKKNSISWTITYFSNNGKSYKVYLYKEQLINITEQEVVQKIDQRITTLEGFIDAIDNIFDIKSCCLVNLSQYINNKETANFFLNNNNNTFKSTDIEKEDPSDYQKSKAKVLSLIKCDN